MKTFRAKRRTGDDGESRVSARRSEAELTKGIGFIMTREGNFLESRWIKLWAVGMAKIFVGHAVGHAKALRILSKSLDTVSISSWDGRNGNMQRSTSDAMAESNAGRLPPPSMISHPSGLLWAALKILAKSFGCLPSSTLYGLPFSRISRSGSVNT